MSTYIDLNPVPAGLVTAGKNQLRTFRWNSHPASLSRQCPTWLSRAEVLGRLGLTEPKRRGYEAYLEGRILGWRSQARRPELEEQWKRERRGGMWGRQTTVSLQWVAARLETGRYTSVTPAVDRMHQQLVRKRLQLTQVRQYAEKGWNISVVEGVICSALDPEAA